MVDCQLGGRFSRCRLGAVQTCQYCGRAFCSEHSYHVGGHDAVCVRKRCRAKWDDLALHLAYRHSVKGRNQKGRCGLEGCEEQLRSECSLCRGGFCADHVRERTYPFSDSRGVVERLVSVCPRCWDRRKLWRRVG